MPPVPPHRPWRWTLALFPNRFGNEVGSRAGSRYGRRHENALGWGKGTSGLVGEGTPKGVGRPVQAANFSALPPSRGVSVIRAAGRGVPSHTGQGTPDAPRATGCLLQGPGSCSSCSPCSVPPVPSLQSPGSCPLGQPPSISMVFLPFLLLTSSPAQQGPPGAGASSLLQPAPSMLIHACSPRLPFPCHSPGRCPTTRHLAPEWLSGSLG